MKKAPLLVLILALLAFRCEDSESIPETPSEVFDHVNGTWEWVSSTGGIAGETIVPTPKDDYAATSRVFLFHTLTFNANLASLRVDNDSPGGLELRQSEFEMKANPNAPDYPNLIFGENKLESVPDIGGIMDFFNDPAVIDVTATTLILQDNCTDCYTHTFIRVK